MRINDHLPHATLYPIALSPVNCARGMRPPVTKLHKVKFRDNIYTLLCVTKYVKVKFCDEANERGNPIALSRVNFACATIMSFIRQ